MAQQPTALWRKQLRPTGLQALRRGIFYNPQTHPLRASLPAPPSSRTSRALRGFPAVWREVSSEPPQSDNGFGGLPRHCWKETGSLPCRGKWRCLPIKHWQNDHEKPDPRFSAGEHRKDHEGVWGPCVHPDARIPSSFQAALAQAPAPPAPTLFPWQRRGGPTYCSCSW